MNVRVNPHVIPGMVQAESISFYRTHHALVPRCFLCRRKTDCRTFRHRHLYAAGRDGQSGAAWVVGRNVRIFSDRMRFKTWYHAAPSFINLSIDPDKCNKATLFRALEENAAIVSRVTCSKLLISGIFILHGSLLQAEVQKGNYGVKFSLMSRDYPSIFRWSKKPLH